MEGEISELNEELEKLCEKITAIEKPMADKYTEKNNLSMEIRKIDQENIELRSK